MVKYFLVAFLALLMFSQTSIASTPKADRVIVHKSQRKMMLKKDGKVLRSYKIALGSNPIGHKIYEGDGRTPVGDYKLTWRNPESKYHLSINISYPDIVDRAVARNVGHPPGGFIMIHGLPNGRTAQDVDHPNADWTDGCIAVTNEEMEEIWEMVNDGTPITIRP